jgi:hypothetical protein
MLTKNKNLNLPILNRPTNLTNKVIIIDGMIGGGKELVSMITSSLPKVEMWMHKVKIEHVCALNHLGHISLNGAKTLLQTWIDEAFFDLNMSRDVNFRPSDHSSMFYYIKPITYLKRLFDNKSKAIERVFKEKPAVNLMTHVNTSYAKPLFEAFGERLIYIRVTRHPMTKYMINHNRRWTERWGNEEIDTQILYKAQSENSNLVNIPFFAKDFEKKYLKANSTDRTIFLFDEWIRKSDIFIDNIKKTTKAKIIEIPFEKFVFQPNDYVKEIALSLGVELNKATLKMMRRQKVPRKSLTDAPNSKSFKKLGWEKPKKILSLTEEFAEGRAFCKKRC